VTLCLDSWAVLSWLDGDEPAYTRVEAVLVDRPGLSWVNAVEVYYRIERQHGRSEADSSLAELREMLDVTLPGVTQMVDVARLRARLAISLADCFAISNAAALGATLLTGDPEILNAPELPCAVEDLRPG
jgi:predicted nucleic acid-binding protein